MAFKRAVTPTFSTKVTVNVPNDRGGYDKSTFTAKFKRPTSEEQEELRSLKNEELVRRVLAGWDLVDADTGEAVPFNAEELEALLAIAPTPLATALAFWETVNGARAKN